MILAGTAGVGARLANLVGVLLPFLGFVAGIMFLWGWGFGWVELGLLLACTHSPHWHHGRLPPIVYPSVFRNQRRREVDSRHSRFHGLAGPPRARVAAHRKHHHHSDEEGDPHSPHQGGSGFLGFLSGFWHAHVGWLFQPLAPDLDCYAKDLQQIGCCARSAPCFSCGCARLANPLVIWGDCSPAAGWAFCLVSCGAACGASFWRIT